MTAAKAAERSDINTLLDELGKVPIKLLNGRLARQMAARLIAMTALKRKTTMITVDDIAVKTCPRGRRIVFMQAASPRKEDDELIVKAVLNMQPDGLFERCRKELLMQRQEAMMCVGDYMHEHKLKKISHGDVSAELTDRHIIINIKPNKFRILREELMDVSK